MTEWLLIMILVWRGSAIEQVLFANQQECLAAKARIEQGFEDGGLTMMCVQRTWTYD